MSEMIQVDAELRERVRTSLLRYQERENLKAQAFAKRIGESLGYDEEFIPYKTLDRFLKLQVRGTNEPLIRNCLRFLDLVSPPTPADTLGMAFEKFLWNMTPPEDLEGSFVCVFRETLADQLPPISSDERLSNVALKIVPIRTRAEDFSGLPVSKLEMTLSRDGKYLQVKERTVFKGKTEYSKPIELTRLNNGLGLMLDPQTLLITLHSYIHTRLYFLRCQDANGSEWRGSVLDGAGPVSEGMAQLGIPMDVKSGMPTREIHMRRIDQGGT